MDAETINPSSGTPPYQQLAGILRRRIASGEFPPGAALPGERGLAQQYGVAIGTVRHALDELRKEGLIYRKQGWGTFVSERPG